MKILGTEDVNKRMPLLKPIAKDIKNLWTELLKHKEEFDNFQGNEDEKEELCKTMECKVDKMNKYIKEIEELDGCVATYSKGEIHFKSLLHGRKVLLCVLPSEEDKVGFWHELDETLGDRVKINKHILKEGKGNKNV